MEHHFNVLVAQQLGIEEAIIVHHFYYWIAKNAANDRHMHEGLYWTYNTKKAYAALFPYMNETKISRVIKHLDEQGLLAKGNYNENPWDKTNWYAFTYDGIMYLQSVGYDCRVLQNANIEGVNLQEGTNQSDLFSTSSNTDNNNTKKEKSEKDPELFEECWLAYRRKGVKKKAKEYWNKLTDVERKNVLPHIKAYVANRDLQYQKDFERYLRDGIFKTVVFNGNKVVYDPTKLGRGESAESVYMPTCDGALSWNDYYNCFMYVGFWDGRHIADGYTDETRPNGATITLNNGRGTITWNSDTKQWEKV